MELSKTTIQEGEMNERMLERLNEIVRLLSRIEQTAIAGTEVHGRIEDIEARLDQLETRLANLEDNMRTHIKHHVDRS